MPEPEQKKPAPRVNNPDEQLVKTLKFPPGVHLDLPGDKSSAGGISTAGESPQARWEVYRVKSERAFRITWYPPGTRSEPSIKWVSEWGCSWELA
jgi:hypothetical protein